MLLIANLIFASLGKYSGKFINFPKSANSVIVLIFVSISAFEILK